MKIFNKEDNKDVVYVQNSDLFLLFSIGHKMPYEVYSKVVSDDMFADSENDKSFTRFTDEESISFFRNLSFIIDFDKVNKRSDDDIDYLYNFTKNEKINLDNKYILNSFNTNDDEVSLQYMILDKQVSDYEDIINFRKGNNKIIFPIVPKSDAFRCETDSYGGYYLSECCDPDKLLLYKINGEEFRNDDTVPLDFLRNSILLCAMESKDKSRFTQGFSTKYSLSEDSLYLIVQLRDEKNIKENSYTVPKTSKVQKLKKKMKDFFSNKK